MVRQNHHLTGTGSRSNNFDANKDFYQTPKWAVQALLERETFSGDILDPCCGDGAIAQELVSVNTFVTAIDIEKRKYGRQEDYFRHDRPYDAVVMNPPFKLMEKFIRRALDQTVVRRGKVAVISRLALLEGQKRKHLFETFPPKKIWVFSNRVNFIAPDGNEIPSSMATCWTVWDWATMGQETTVGWI